MEVVLNRQAVRAGGICGILGVACYAVAASINSLPDNLVFLLVMMWSVLSIVYAYTLYRVIAAERNTAFNRLGLIFAIAGFAMVAEMLAIQLAVRGGWTDIKPTLSADAVTALTPAYHVVRMVDQGLDVAWDIFIGAALVLSGAAMVAHSRFRWIWGGLSVFFGVALIGLNVATFPYPPAERGLFDIGPFIAVFLFALNIRLLILSRSFNLSARQITLSKKETATL